MADASVADAGDEAAPASPDSGCIPGHEPFCPTDCAADLVADCQDDHWICPVTYRGCDGNYTCPIGAPVCVCKTMGVGNNGAPFRIWQCCREGDVCGDSLDTCLSASCNVLACEPGTSEKWIVSGQTWCDAGSDGSTDGGADAMSD